MAKKWLLFVACVWVFLMIIAIVTSHESPASAPTPPPVAVIPKPALDKSPAMQAQRRDLIESVEKQGFISGIDAHGGLMPVVPEASQPQTEADRSSQDAGERDVSVVRLFTIEVQYSQAAPLVFTRMARSVVLSTLQIL